MADQDPKTPVSKDMLDFKKVGCYTWVQYCIFTVKPEGQAYPQEFFNEFIIRKLNLLLVVDFRGLADTDGKMRIVKCGWKKNADNKKSKKKKNEKCG